MKNSIFLFFLFSFLSNFYTVFSQTEIKGKIINASTKKSIPNAVIKVFYGKSWSAWYSVVSDSSGNYSINDVRPFKYNLLCSKDEFNDQVIINNRTPRIGFVIVDFYLKNKNNLKESRSATDTLEYQSLIKSMGKYTSLIVEPNVKKLKEDIKRNWHINNDSTSYATNEEFTNNLMLVYKDCIVGYSPKRIIKLFGKPSQIFDVRGFHYSFGYTAFPPCSNDNCLTLYFVFNDKHKFQGFQGSISHLMGQPEDK